MNDKNNEIEKDKKDFNRRMWIATWVTLVLPPITGIFMLSFVGVFPFPEVFYPFFDYAAIVIFCSIAVGVQINRKLISNIEQLINSPDDPNNYKKRLKRLPLYYFSILFVYFALGLVATLYSLSSLHGFDYKLEKYFISFLGVIPGGLITALPIFFYITDTLGSYLSPRGIHITVAPIKLKLIVLGLFVPVLIDTLLIMYFYDRTGYFSIDTIGIWAFLIVIAATGTLMAWRSFQQSMSPFVNALNVNKIQNYSEVSIIPQSLDELGLLSYRWQSLWKQVIKYEKQLATANELLRSDVLQRTHELKTERIFIDKVLENASALIIVLDRTGRIVRFNPACEKITGFTFIELNNRPIWDWLIPPEQLEDVKQVFSNLSDEGMNSQYENDLMTREGRRIPVTWNNSSIKDNTGCVEYIVSIGIDISERREAEQAIEEARDHAEKANTAKSEFLSRMSHELRTPMNAILGFGQILEMDAKELNETQQTNVKEILDAGHHLLTLINEVLDLATIESGKLEIFMEKVDVDDAIHQSVALIHPLAEVRNIELCDHVSGKGHIIQADPTRLKQVLVNLLSNAVKYNSENGRITLDSKLTDNQHLRICVTDTGTGLTQEEIAKLFVSFERLDKVNNVEGTGIGLVITKHLVELMGGSIGIDCVPGEGSTFWVEFEVTA